MMKTMYWAVLAGILGISGAAPLSAAPVGPSSLVTAAESGTTQVGGRCYRHRGHWHCPRHSHYRSYYDRPYYGYYQPFYKPYYYGYPRFGFYFGGRRGWYGRW